LYGERVGALHVVCRSETAQAKTLGLLTRISRAEITTAPINGARIVATILDDEHLKAQWLADLAHMSGRMRSMRGKLVEGLRERNMPGSWDHVLTDVCLPPTRQLKQTNFGLIREFQIGMFSMTGLSPIQIEQLREEHHVYLLPSGRISVTGCEC